MCLSLWKIQVHSYKSLSLREKKKKTRLLYWASLSMPCYNNVKNLNDSLIRKQHNVNLSFFFFKHVNNNTDATKPCVRFFLLGVDGWLGC